MLLVVVGSAQAQSPIDGVDARSNPAEFSKQLGSADANVRRRSAEALAQLAATDQRKLVEGYQLQEKQQGSSTRARLGFVSHGSIRIAVSNRR